MNPRNPRPPDERPGPQREFYVGVVNAAAMIVVVLVLILASIWWLGSP
jgi:hypothetical protein